MPGTRFEFDASISRCWKDDEGNHRIRAVVSDNRPDRQRDRVAKSLLHKFADQCKAGTLLLLPSHKDSFEIGKFVDGVVIDKGNGHAELEVEAVLDPRFPEAQILYGEVEMGVCVKQLSIGGKLNFSNPQSVAFEFENGHTVRVLKDAELEHIAVTRSQRAANPRTRFTSALVKAMDEEFDQVLSEKSMADTDGHWLFSEGFIAYARERGLITKDDGKHTAIGFPASEESPEEQREETTVDKTEEGDVLARDTLKSVLEQLVKTRGDNIEFPEGHSTLEDFWKSLEGMEDEAAHALVMKAVENLTAAPLPEETATSDDTTSETADSEAETTDEDAPEETTEPTVTDDTSTATETTEKSEESGDGLVLLRKDMEKGMAEAQKNAVNAVLSDIAKAVSDVNEARTSLEKGITEKVEELLKSLTERIETLESALNNVVSKTAGSQLLKEDDTTPNRQKKQRKGIFGGLLGGAVDQATSHFAPPTSDAE